MNENEQRQTAALWASETFGDAELGNVKRTKRLVKVAAAMAGAAGASPSRACGNDKAALEGAYRLLRNEQVEPEAILEAGFRSTAKSVLQCDELLAVEDTTTLSYRHAMADELGDVGGPQERDARGILVHSVLLLDSSTGRTVGLVEQEYWTRDPSSRGKKHQRKRRSFEDKESFKWRRASEKLRERLDPEAMARTVSVCDREADVYEYLSYKVELGERFIVRAAWDRKVEAMPDDEAREVGHLFELLGNAQRLGAIEVAVPQRGGRSARIATLSVRAKPIRIVRPARLSSDVAPPRIEVNAILAREDASPPGAEPLEWLLLTNEPISTAEQVLDVLRRYRLRWRIEEFHKAWKSGAGVERRRMQTADNILRVAALLAFVAVRLLQLRETLEHTPDAPCDKILTSTEWKVLWVAVEKKQPPRRPPTVQWAYHAIGRLGGWSDSKRTGRMGWQSYWLGWIKLHERVAGYEAALLVGGPKK